MGELSGSGPPAPPRVRLARLPTPIEPLVRYRAAPASPPIDIKRDDLTGLLVSGNKIRKLEFLLADARARGATCLITCGGGQSNHARATAAAAARLGLRAVLLLKPTAGAPGPEATPEGNLFLDRMLGAEVRWIDAEAYEQREARMIALERELRGAGEVPYRIPEGASNALGAWGYLTMIDELLAQEPSCPWTTIVCAVGSGGTYAGLLLGARLRGLRLRVRGYLVQRTAEYFRRRILVIGETFARRHDIPLPFRRDEIELVEDFVGPGYAEVYPEETATIRELARREGILLDPVYTGKAFTGLVQEIRAGIFGHEERILFLHTGGLFGAFAQRDALLPCE